MALHNNRPRSKKTRPNVAEITDCLSDAILRDNKELFFQDGSKIGSENRIFGLKGETAGFAFRILFAASTQHL